jgi:MFS family permease
MSSGTNAKSSGSNKSDETSSPLNSAALYVTYINIVLYALCFQLQRPIEPFLVQQLSKNAPSSSDVTRTYGQLQSFFSAIQTIGSPITGILLDRVGIRITSCIVFLASALSYGILSIATEDMHMLFYSKIPTAFQVS